MIDRIIEKDIIALLGQFPSVAILGPRQVGKTTLAKRVAKMLAVNSIYLDLEKPSDLASLAEPELYFQKNEGHLIILDEVQRMPGLFQILRGIIDERRANGMRACQFLLLGSASKELLQQSSESLAGRIVYKELAGFSIQEVSNSNLLWLRGGFPDSYLVNSDEVSLTWRQSFIRTYLEREIPQMGLNIPAETLHRFWTMLAHLQSDLLNASKLAGALGVSQPTIMRYLDMLSDLFLVRLLRPWSSNLGKRLVKAPKVYIRDSGIAHALLNLMGSDDLFSHPVVGGSFEGFVIENIITSLAGAATPWFYRTSGGAEIDLLLEYPSGKKIAIEIKRSLTPVLSRGFYSACEDLKPDKAYVVYAGNARYPLSKDVEVVSLQHLLSELNSYSYSQSRSSL